jgi:hypothetical protein
MQASALCPARWWWWWWYVCVLGGEQEAAAKPWDTGGVGRREASKGRLEMP